MRRLVFLALLPVLLVAPTRPASAEDREWSAEVPKQGTSGFLECRAEGIAGGNRYRYLNWVDAGEGQIPTCERWAREDVSRYFQMRYGVQIDPASIQITYRLVP